MNQNGNGLNGYHSNNSVPPSSNPYADPSHPPVNPPIYQNPLPMAMRQPQSTNIHAMPQNLWSSMVPQNPLPPSQAQQPQPFNPSSWPNQMQYQGFSNAMPTMFNMPLSVQHLLHEAATMVAPVGEEDEPLLIQALLDSHNNRMSYKDALNGLHGRNNHSGSLWKDYYLDHKHRLDELVERSTTSVKTAKKPLLHSFNVDTSPGYPSSQSVSKKRHRHSIQPTVPPKPLTSSRKTINSLTTHAPVFDDRLPPPNAQVTIPDPPSRSPTPPTMVVPQGRGNKYTPADKDFFLKFIAWRLKCDPTLTRMELCKELEVKAPHHTELSWASYWSNNHDVPDKIMATAKGEDFAEGQSDSDEEEQSNIVRKPKYQSNSSSEAASEAEIDPHSDGEQDRDEETSSADERDMGPTGGPFTTADLRVTAKHVASIPDFENASFQEKWEDFQKRYPQRSLKSWAQYYRTREDAINRLAKKYRKQRQATEVYGQSSIHSQRGRPSWASSSDLGGINPPKAKRKFTTSDDERFESNRKRTRDEDEEEDEEADGEYEEDNA